MIIVTGGAGFIGSNLVGRLCQTGHDDVVVVDDLQCGQKFSNVVEYDLMDYWSSEEFLSHLLEDKFGEKPRVVFHQGACSDTTEWNGAYMMKNNFTFSKLIFEYCLKFNIPFIYASSASVYGMGQTFQEVRQNEVPLNVYGYSKVMFDRFVRRRLRSLESQVVGLRYFNVYGPNESHKGNMASIVWQLYQQAQNDGRLKLFAGTGGYADGEQRRDFIYVDDVVDVNMWFWQEHGSSGIYNCGTGSSQTFNDLANAVIAAGGRGEIEYIPFPKSLEGHYQSFTEADITALREAGYDKSFLTVEEGVARYLKFNRRQ